MKRILVLVVCLALAVTALCACTPDKTETLSSNDVYGLGAVSTVKLLGSEMSAKALRRLAKVSETADNADATTGADSQVKTQAEKFNEYFTALDSFMGEELVSTVSEKNTDSNYKYDTKLTIKSRDFDGKAVENVMYFTETLAETIVDDDDDKNDKDDEKETRYTLEGIMVVDGKDYYLHGERTEETEKDESENELKIRAYADLTDKDNYVEMEQEHSQETNENEIEYVYSIVSQGQIVEQTAVEFETENKGAKEEVEYEMEFRKGEAKGRYEIVREEKNNKVQIKVKYNIDGKSGQFHVEKTTDGKYSYKFEDGSTVTF